MQLLYLLDANVLIDAHYKSYPIDRIPEFWAWLVSCARQQQVKIPLEIYQEISPGRTGNPLYDWLKGKKNDLCLDELVDGDLVRRVISEGYAPDLTDEEIENCGCDPFLISYGLRNREERVIVTNEVSKPSKTRANRHIPDVCQDLGISYCNTWRFIRRLDFRTSRFS